MVSFVPVTPVANTAASEPQYIPELPRIAVPLLPVNLTATPSLLPPVPYSVRSETPPVVMSVEFAPISTGLSAS